VREFPRENRNAELDKLLIREGTALDVGTGGTFSMLFPQRKFSKVVAISANPDIIAVMEDRHEDWLECRFRWCDVRGYIPQESFDLITMLHVAEHLLLPELGHVLDTLTAVCRKQFVIETPEQFDDNMAAVEEEDDGYELHVSLVTAAFLAHWGFEPWARYWQNEKFSNAIYVRTTNG
jgi:2-polyprenyl-3-methyl-5-hydroxy-6-metoxy-1,4-benzoquinol methylase